MRRWRRKEKEGESLTKELLQGMEKGEISPPSGYAFRTACQMCEYPVPQADIRLKLFGYKARSGDRH